MLSRRALEISVLSSSGVVVGWCRRHSRRRRKGGIIRLGGRRRGFSLGPRPVVPPFFRALRRIVIRMAANGKLVEAYCWALPFLRPQIFFPLC
ncbi:Unknown protein [Striga hermonthica]|uniref:Uncharacterized protein n=1 Tax=Striga hermonthica TaxID=68872 RepID=A0A9N7NP25_STRHE|nr:Unknown protein [Striga hermonthica]